MADNDKPASADESDNLEKPSTVIQPVAGGSGGEKKPPQEAELSGNTPDPRPPGRGPTILQRLLSFSNLYLLVFVVILLGAGVAIFLAVKNDKQNKSPEKGVSLTDQQLATLKGSTTVIGDSQQVLDIQSNAVFENQALFRKDLDVAGTLRVGGPLSLASVTVGGTSSFGQLQVNNNLTVAGNTSLQGLTVSGNASFKTLSVSQLNVTTIQFTGDLSISRHIAGSGGVPTRTNGSALGGGGTSSVNGSDTAGNVTINTGGSPPAGCFITVNFAQKFNDTPFVIISPSNSNSAGLSYYTNRSSTSFSVCTTNAPAAATSYLFDYVVID